MKNEIKIKLSNFQKMRAKLLALGGAFFKEKYIIDTYFNQRDGFVLKLQESQTSSHLISLKAVNGGFMYLKNESVTALEDTKEHYTRLFGIKCVQKKHNWYYYFRGKTVVLATIENLGHFLVVIGEDIAPEFITRELNVKNPTYIYVPFSQLV